MSTVGQLIDYITKGDMINLERELAANPAIVLQTTPQGISLLILAAYYRNKEAIKIIKDHLPSITPHEAVVVGDIENVSRFLKKDKSWINAYSSDGFTPLGYACFFGHFPIVKRLIEAGAEVNVPSNNDFKVAPIHSAAAISNMDICRLLIANGAHVNATQQSGVTALHSAAHNGSLELAKLLLANGADKNLFTVDGKKPIDYARQDNHPALVELLS